MSDLEKEPSVGFSGDNLPLRTYFARTAIKAACWVGIPSVILGGTAFCIAEYTVAPEIDGAGDQVNETLETKSGVLNDAFEVQANELNAKVDEALGTVEDARTDVAEIKEAMITFFAALGFELDAEGNLQPIGD